MTDVQTNGKTKTKTKVAEHDFIDATGTALDNEDAATSIENDAQGYRYTLLANGETFDWYWSQANDTEKRLLALFGAKTLATNETSQVRNNIKGAGSAAEQMEALRERFAMLRNGQWVDRTREPGVAKIDKKALAGAIVDVLIAKGKIQESDRDTTFATKFQQLEEDATYMRKARLVPEVSTAYAARVGKQTVSVDDL